MRVFLDWVDGTTTIFLGTISSIRFEWYPTSICVVTALDYSSAALKTIVNETLYSRDVGAIFVYLIGKYLGASGHTYANVNQSTGYTTSVQWVNKTLFQCLQDLATYTNDNYAFYCDANKDWHFFEKGSVFNQNEAVVYGANLRNLTWEVDQADNYNKVTVIGATINGIPLTATYSTGAGDKEKVVQDTNITDWNTLYNKAKSLVDIYSIEEHKGTAKCKGMSGLNPGDAVYFFSPEQALQGEFIVSEFTHTIDSSGFNTNLKFQERARTKEDLATYLIENMNQIKQQVITDNPYGLKNVRVISSISDNYTTSGSITFSNGVMGTASTGVATTIQLTADANVSQIYVKVIGEDLANISLRFSVDDQYISEVITRETVAVPVGTGKKINIEVSLLASTAKVSSLGIYYT